MSKNSEAVKRWRASTKTRMVEAMGGKCACCGYDKCERALAFHHIEPEHKDLSFSNIRSSPKSWDKIVKELKKCIPVCHNCHSEIHEGVLEIPKNFPKFDKNYLKYKDTTNKTPCVVCGKLKPERNITCSKACANKNRRKVDWDSVDLLKLKEKYSFCEIADMLGVSDSAVSKRFKKLNVQ